MLFSLQVFLDCLSVFFMEATTFSKFKTGHLLGLEMRNSERGVLYLQPACEFCLGLGLLPPKFVYYLPAHIEHSWM